MKYSYTWEENEAIVGKFNKSALFGYIEPFMDFRYAPHHENALCSIYKRENKWCVDVGKDKKLFDKKHRAISWAMNVLGVKTLRYDDFRLLTAHQIDVAGILEEFKSPLPDVYGCLTYIGHFCGYSYTPLDFVEQFKDHIQTKLRHTIEDINLYIDDFYEDMELEVDYSAWLYSPPSVQGDYLVCKYDGEIHQVSIEIEEASNEVVVINKRGERFLLKEVDASETWIWAHDFGYKTLWDGEE
ncbi:conserved hypothetical protein [Vibrio chagasii]|nr:conserved hypothetical protein [Vibrio chagasii]CAH7046497.1 conserved hypothetical protein [Vibrio chagasii]CAH7057341.1 conserved hypothetical protein [Vibrio chagasii]CAH7111869.1 conserved hypothetical protein [Vibrio chagasii]CAH7220208.1 conserved hypothetical protein [Vibrio chagasii]